MPFSWQTVSAGALRSGSRSRRYTSASSARRLRRTSGPILSRATSPALAWCGRISNRGTRPLFGGGLVVPVSDDVMIHIDLPRQARDKQTTKTAHKKDLKTTFKLKKTVVVVVARQGCTSLTSFVIGTEYSVRKTSRNVFSVHFFGDLYTKYEHFTKTGSGRTHNREGAARNKSELYYYYYYHSPRLCSPLLAADLPLDRY